MRIRVVLTNQLREGQEAGHFSWRQGGKDERLGRKAVGAVAVSQ